MDEHQFQALLHRTNEKPTLEQCQIKLNTLQHPLHVKGKFETIIRNQTCGKPATFVVVKGRINSPPLLSKDTLIELGMLKLRPDGGLTSPNAMRIENDKPKTVKSTTNQPEQQEMDKIIAKYDHLFQGIGKITDKKSNREIYGQFHMKPEAIPVTQKPRPVPYHLQKPLKEWLQQGVEEDIFEQVPDDEPVTWCSPLVIQPKPRFAKTPKEELGPPSRLPSTCPRSRITGCRHFCHPMGELPPETTSIWSQSITRSIRGNNATNLRRHPQMLEPERRPFNRGAELVRTQCHPRSCSAESRRLWNHIKQNQV